MARTRFFVRRNRGSSPCVSNRVEKRKKAMSKFRQDEADALETLIDGGSFLKKVWEKYQPMQKLSGVDAMMLQDCYGLSIFDIAILACSHKLSVDFREYYKLKDRVSKFRQCDAPLQEDIKDETK